MRACARVKGGRKWRWNACEGVCVLDGDAKMATKDKGGDGRGRVAVASAARPCEPPSASPALKLADFSLRALHIIWVGSGGGGEGRGGVLGVDV